MKTFRRNLIAISFSIVFVLGFLIDEYARASSSCYQTIAAFDIGSVTTRMKVAKVDICENRILEILLETIEHVGYMQDLSQSSSSEFSPQVQTVGIDILTQLKNKATQYTPEAYIGVATSAFRTAKNASKFIKRIQNDTGIPVRVISQKEEALLGFYAASELIDHKSDDIIVWDIGGGSMQITAINDKDELTIYEGELASLSFKNEIIKAIQNKDPKLVDSPNPISFQQLEVAVSLAEQHAVKVPQFIKEKIKSKNAVIVGIGAVNYYSIRDQVNAIDNTYTREMVENALKNSAGLTDKEIGGEYASTEISNLALVLGYMKALNINSVITAKINMADGLLLYPKFNPEQFFKINE